MQYLNPWRRWSMPDYFDARQVQTGKVEVDATKCIACGTCARCCPVGSIIVPKASQRESEPTHVLKAGPDLFMCFACSNCVTACPKDAITVSRRYMAHYYFNRLFRAPEMTPPKKY